jgi:acetyl esterase/lipase
MEVECVQANQEGDLVEQVHAAAGCAGLIINPGALTHTSHALHDALEALTAPAVEVHLSNVRRRERWRRRSAVAPACVLSIFGRGAEGYRAALRHLARRAASPPTPARYGPHPDQYLHLRPGGDGPAVILIHGGFWGDAWGLDSVEGWAVDLSRRGVPTASIEYRRVGSGGGWLATPADVERAIAAACGLLGTGDFVVVGHSAGAHLAMWHAAGTPRAPRLTVGVAGIYDLTAARRDGLGEGAVAAFDPDHRTDLLTAPAPSSPVALVHGADDQVVPPSQSLGYTHHLERSGHRVESLAIPGGGHFDLLDPDRPAWQAVRQRLEAAGIVAG